MKTRKQKPEATHLSPSLDETYPHLASWIQDGWVEIGKSEDLESFVKAFDTGGMVFEGKAKYKRLEDALQDLNDGIKRWCEETGIDLEIEKE